jgi:HAD superfamily hydrolase (TIGR01509 family)
MNTLIPSSHTPKYQGILFDCDGTLVDSEFLLSSLLARKIRELGYPEFDDHQCRTLFKGHNYDYIRPWLINNLKNFPVEKFELEFFPIATHEIPTHLKEIPGAKLLLASLKTYPKCIVSSGHLHVINYSLEITDLKQYFDDHELFTCELVKHPKPAPDLYKLACKKMGFDPSKSIAIEDSVVGVAAAIAAGITTVGIIAHKEDEVLVDQMINLGVHKIIYKLSELQDIVWV